VESSPRPPSDLPPEVIIMFDSMTQTPPLASRRSKRSKSTATGRLSGKDGRLARAYDEAVSLEEQATSLTMRLDRQLKSTQATVDSAVLAALSRISTLGWCEPRTLRG
jgi:hypothetical protein